MAQAANVRLNANQQQQQSGKMEQANDAKTPAGKVKPSYKHIPHSQKPPHLVAKRNARERRRVQAVNQAFYKLRKSVPIENRTKRVSKVKTLQRAIDYIRRLERILAEDDETQTAGVAPSGGQQAGHRSQGELEQRQVDSYKLPQEAQQPLQETSRSKLNSSDAVRGNAERAPTRDGPDLKSSSPSARAKRGPRSSGADDGGKRAQMTGASAEVAGQGVRGLGRKQPASKSKQAADDLRHSSQAARAHQAAGPVQQEDGNYVGGVKSAASSSTSGLEALCCATAAASAPLVVSYGKPQDGVTTTSLSASRLVGVPPPPPDASQHHYPGHHYQYYVDSPTSMAAASGEQLSSSSCQLDQFAYNNQPQQRAVCLSGEISSSMTNGPALCGNYLPASYQHYAAPSPFDGHCALDAHTHHHYQSLVNHTDSYAPRKPVDSPTSTINSHQQRYFPPPPARHFHAGQTPPPPHNTWSQQTAAREPNDLLDSCIKRGESDKRPEENDDRKQAEYGPDKAIATTAQSMPADSTSSSARKDLASNQPNGVRSPPGSICSSSSLSPSTSTLKSLDLSGGASSTNALFGSINRSDKSPTTSAVNVCRQPRESALENGAHSATGRADYVGQQQQQQQRRTGANNTNGQQQVNNYARQLPAYAAHLSCAPHSDSTTSGYLKGNQLQGPDGQRAIKLSALRNGSRSSSAISPDPIQQLPLVGGNYLANNNLHAADQQHSTQLFQYRPAYYSQQHLHQQQHQLHDQQHHQSNRQQDQQSLYQGQHFLGNHQNHDAQQTHNFNHLSDHHHHHHLQSDSSSTSELRQQNEHTFELATTTNIGHHQQLERLMTSNSTATITTASTQFTALPL